MNGATEHRTKSENGRRNSVGGVGGVGGVCKSAVNIHSYSLAHYVRSFVASPVHSYGGGAGVVFFKRR
jgi:hypothetical protein